MHMGGVPDTHIHLLGVTPLESSQDFLLVPADESRVEKSGVRGRALGRAPLMHGGLGLNEF